MNVKVPQIAAMALFCLVGSAKAATLQVDDDGMECPMAGHTTIVSALAAAAPSGDTIEVCPGTYSIGASVEVTKSVIIDGTDRDTVFVNADTNSTFGFHVRIGDVTISDLTIRSTGGATATNGIRFEETLAMTPLDNLVVDNVVFDGFDDLSARGIEMHLGTFNDFTVRDSQFLNNRNGIRFGSDTVLDGMVLTGSTFMRSSNTADFCCNGLYQANDGNTSTFRGLQASNNTFTNYALAGMFIEEIRDSTIEMNEFTDNYTGIIIFKDYTNAMGTEVQGVVISDNTFNDNTGRAVFLQATGRGLGTGNQVVDNDIFVDASLAPFSNLGSIQANLDGSLSHELLTLSGNNITFSGSLAMDRNLYGIHLRGDGPVDITLGNLDGGPVVPSGTGAFAGIFVDSNNSTYSAREDAVNVSCNTISGFDEGIRVFDTANGVIGGLGSGVTFDVMTNDIAGNTSFGINNGGTSETIDADSNYWGDSSGPSGAGPGSGDAISTNVDASSPLFGVQVNCTVPVDLMQFEVD